jgi:DNA polymerase-1
VTSRKERAAIKARQRTSSGAPRSAWTTRLRAYLSGRLLLQVHDELGFEVPDEEVAPTAPVVTKVMVEAP